MKKKIIIGSAIVLAIIGYIFGYFFIRDIVRETKLLDEVDEIDNVLNTENANLDEVEEQEFIETLRSGNLIQATGGANNENQ